MKKEIVQSFQKFQFAKKSLEYISIPVDNQKCTLSSENLI